MGIGKYTRLIKWLGICLLVVVGFIVWLIKSNKKKNDPTNSVSIDVNETATTVSKSELDILAERQYTAMRGLGTRNDIATMLHGLSPDDLRYIYNEFGKRKYSAFGNAALLGFKLDLFGWYKKELSKSELSEMRDIWFPTGLRFPD